MARNQGFDHADDFFVYMGDAFETLYSEGANGQAGMMSIGLHCRLIGRPARIAGLTKFLDYVMKRDRVWIAKRNDIAHHWADTHPYSE